MSKPSARGGDPTGHGGVINPASCSKNVFINGLPAATIASMHNCPMVTPGTPPVPHVGGPVVSPGIPNVFINGAPAIGMGDQFLCVGSPPAPVVVGSANVVFGGARTLNVKQTRADDAGKASEEKDTEQMVTKMYWCYWNGEKYIELEEDCESRHHVDVSLFVETENYDDGETVSVTIKSDNGEPLFGDTLKLELKGTVNSNKAIFKDVFKKYTLEHCIVDKQETDYVEEERAENKCFCGKEHIDLRSKVIWKTQLPDLKACFRTCKSILVSTGLSDDSANPHDVYQVMKEVLNVNVDNQKDQTAYLQIDIVVAKDGLAYIDEQLEEGYPVLVGVDHTYGRKANHDKTTDHFVIIVGRGCDDNKVFYTFYEVGTGDEEKGTSDNNKLYINENFSLSGNPVYKPDRSYFVTQIRKNRKSR